MYVRRHWDEHSKNHDAYLENLQSKPVKSMWSTPEDEELLRNHQRLATAKQRRSRAQLQPLSSSLSSSLTRPMTSDPSTSPSRPRTQGSSGRKAPKAGSASKASPKGKDGQPSKSAKVRVGAAPAVRSPCLFVCSCKKGATLTVNT